MHIYIYILCLSIMCMYVCTYVCICVYIYMYVCVVCVCVHVYLSTNLPFHQSVNVRTCILIAFGYHRNFLWIRPSLLIITSGMNCKVDSSSFCCCIILFICSLFWSFFCCLYAVVIDSKTGALKSMFGHDIYQDDETPESVSDSVGKTVIRVSAFGDNSYGQLWLGHTNPVPFPISIDHVALGWPIDIEQVLSYKYSCFYFALLLDYHIQLFV